MKTGEGWRHGMNPGLRWMVGVVMSLVVANFWLGFWK